MDSYMPTINDIRNLLQAGHQNGDDTAEETLNRLWIKHIESRKRKYGDQFVKSAPRFLSDDTVAISLEDWSTKRLSSLIRIDRSKPPRVDKDIPVVIVKYCDKYCLIDGGRRITKWRRESDSNSHKAYVLTRRN